MNNAKSMILLFPSQKKLFDFMPAIRLSSWELSITTLTLTASFSSDQINLALRNGAVVVDAVPDKRHT